MKDKQLEALIRKTTGKVAQSTPRQARFVDPTLIATRRPEDEGRSEDSQKLFKEMKKREF